MRRRPVVFCTLLLVVTLLTMNVSAVAAQPTLSGAERWRAMAPGANAATAIERRLDSGLATALGATGEIAIQAADDVLPGVQLDAELRPPHVVTGTLSATADVHDIYSVRLVEGEQLIVLMTGSGADFDLELWSPDTASLVVPDIVVESRAPGSSTERVCYTVSPRFGAGRYYIVPTALDAGSGDGSYTFEWNVSSRSDGNVPGVPAPLDAMRDRVDALSDANDVFRLPAGPGATIEVDLVADDPSDTLVLSLYEPSSEALGPTDDIFHGSRVAFQSGAKVKLTYEVPAEKDGVYYIDVDALDSLDAGYTLTWTASGPNVPGAPVPSARVTESLAAPQLHPIDVPYPAVLRVTADGVTTARAELRLFAPGTTDVATGKVLAAQTGPGDPKNLTWTVPAGGDGLHHIEVAPFVPGDATTSWSIDIRSLRLAGPDRYHTSVAAARDAFAGGADTVVVASGADFPDALAASGLAGAYDAPVLLTMPTVLPSAVREEIKRLGATRCFVVGGTRAVEGSVLSAIDALPGMTTPVRLAGPDRYGTAAAVARQVVSRRGLLYDGTVFVARGDGFADALAVSPLAWSAAAPVVLTAPGSLPAASADVLREIGADRAVLAGGSTAISAATEGAIARITGLTIRREGSNRYGTASAVAAWGVNEGLADYRYVGVATGEGFADALGGGAACGKRGGVLLLTDPDRLSAPTAATIDGRRAGISRLRVFGGASAVSTSAEAAIDTLLR